MLREMCLEPPTQILNIHRALVPHTRLMHAHILPIRNRGAITSLRDPQPMNVEPRRLGNLFVDLCCRGIRAHGDGFGEVLDGSACVVCE
jgi:hypothetical protein